MVRAKKGMVKKNAGNRDERVMRALSSFRHIVSAAKSQLSRVRQHCDLSGAQLWALSHVKQNPGLTVQQVAEAMSVRHSTASNLVEALDRGGYVRKVREERDRRFIKLFLTSKGSEVLKKAPDRPSGALPEAMKQLSESELQVLERALESLSQKMRLVDRGSA